MSFDVVHAANPPDFLLLAARPLRRRGARFVFDHHDLSPELYLARLPSAARTRLVHRLVHRMLLLSERMAFRQADVVIATNQSYRRIATTRGGKSPADVFVVRNAPDPERFHPNPVVRDRDGKHVIGYVGMIGPQDGVDHALRALRSLRSRRDDWRAFFAGDGDALPELQRLAQQLELDDVVEFLGLVGQDDVVRLLSTADVCLAPEPRNPANEASTMIKVAEYMSMGRPVVAYDLAETRATAGPAALYAERDDPEALADAIDLLLDDPMRRETMGNAGRKRVVEKLAWTYSARALEAAYGRVLDVTAVRSTADAAERGTTDACSVSSS
jgi:glycosyltransferase involved in cell wall biosynthesis